MLKIANLEFVYMTGHVCRIAEVSAKYCNLLAWSFAPVTQTVLLQPSGGSVNSMLLIF